MKFSPYVRAGNTKCIKTRVETGMDWRGVLPHTPLKGKANLPTFHTGVCIETVKSRNISFYLQKIGNFSLAARLKHVKVTKHASLNFT